ncbi:sigma factor [Nocardia alni]|uniref:sigma factor n=1 Tax=Nocardia alni TaxID=2815723 RepID=UPI001C218DDB|nr:sigma factor [Nocardia alni]
MGDEDFSAGGSERRLAELLVAVSGGERDAFAVLYQLTSSRVFGLAVRMMRDRATAEEITREVYERVWASAGREDEWMASPMGWLTMLTHRAAVDREWVDGRTYLGRDHDADVESAEQRVGKQAMLPSLDSVTPLQRESIVLAYYGGLTYSQVAQLLDTPTAIVKSRIRGGLRLLAGLSGRTTNSGAGPIHSAEGLD